MFMHIVTQLSGRGMALFTQVLGWLKALLCKLVSNLRVNFIRVSQSVISPCNRLAKTLLNFKVLAASLITAGQSTKAALRRVVTISGQTGQQLVTIAHQTLQRVIKQLNQSKKHVASIKLVQLVTQKLTRVLTLTGQQLKALGLKYQECVSQRQQRAQRQNSKGR